MDNRHAHITPQRGERTLLYPALIVRRADPPLDGYVVPPASGHVTVANRGVPRPIERWTDAPHYEDTIYRHSRQLLEQLALQSYIPSTESGKRVTVFVTPFTARARERSVSEYEVEEPQVRIAKREAALEIYGLPRRKRV